LKMSVDSFVEGFVTSLFLGQQGENNWYLNIQKIRAR
jgi:hypothetical protein